MQSVVEKLHFRHRTEVQALARTVEQAWKELKPVNLMKVFRRWKMVLDLIIEDEDGNRKVEAKQGKNFCAPEAEAEDFKEEDE